MSTIVGAVEERDVVLAIVTEAPILTITLGFGANSESEGKLELLLPSMKGMYALDLPASVSASGLLKSNSPFSICRYLSKPSVMLLLMHSDQTSGTIPWRNAAS